MQPFLTSSIVNDMTFQCPDLFGYVYVAGTYRFCRWPTNGRGASYVLSLVGSDEVPESAGVLGIGPSSFRFLNMPDTRRDLFPLWVDTLDSSRLEEVLGKPHVGPSFS